MPDQKAETEKDWIDSEQLENLTDIFVNGCDHNNHFKAFLRKKRVEDIVASYQKGYLDGCPPTPVMELKENLQIMTNEFKKREGIDA